MATYTRPDIYIEEILTPDRAPTSGSTSIAAFIGATQRGPANKAIFIDSFDAFVRVFGDALLKEPLYYTVRSFFQNGGSGCYVVRLVSKAAIDTPIEAANASIQANTTDFLKFSSGYRSYPSYGLSGENLRVKVVQSDLFTPQAGGDIVVANNAVGQTSIQVASNAGLVADDFIKVTDHDAAVSFHTVAGTRTALNAGVLEYFIDLRAPLAAAINFGANSTISLLSYSVIVYDQNDVELERFSNLSVNPEADSYIETVINDEEIGSRFIIVEDLEATLTPSADRVIDAGQLDLVVALSNNGEDELAGFTLADDFIGDADTKTGLEALTSKSAVNLLVVPPSTDKTNGIFPSASIPNIHGGMLAYCSKRLDMFAILDTPADLIASKSGATSVGSYRSSTLGVDNYWGALYYPHLSVYKDSKRKSKITIPPSGAVAGLYSRVDALGAPNGGVASSPAGYDNKGSLQGVIGLAADVSESAHGELNEIGVNCIRIIESGSNALPSPLVLGARTLSSRDDFRYINTRRIMTYIEREVKEIAKPFLFRNNGPRLWDEMSIAITNFISDVYAEGSLAGNSERQAFFVKIDSTTNTADNIQRGILVGEIGVSLLRPAEFVVFRFSQNQIGGQE